MKERKKIGLKHARVPRRLRPYFQEYVLEHLEIERDANIIIQRTLEFGTWQEIEWLFCVYGIKRIKQFVGALGERGLSRIAFNYWRKLLAIKTWRKSPFPIARQDVWPYS
jgi:hypothetical protein